MLGLISFIKSFIYCISMILSTGSFVASVHTESWIADSITPDTQVADFIVGYIRVYQYK